MKIVGLYSIYDRKAQLYLPLFQAERDELAHRQFVEVIMTSGTHVTDYPADFDLVRLGVLNLENGSIEPEHPIGLLMNGLVALEAALHEKARYEAITKRIYEQTPSEDTPTAS